MAQKTTAAKTATTKKTAKTPRKSGKYLLIVESPTKAKTIKKYLGDKYEVLSSVGHIKDLPASRLAVDIEHDFKPEFIVPRKTGKAAIIRELKAANAKYKKTYLATDPDREGEAIAWHLAQELGLDVSDDIRVTFDEITKKEVTKKIAEPTKIDINLVNAQQARRVLDRIVGYKLSPFLWHKVKRGLSAGRVQSVATKMVVDRENEIRAFVPREFWNLDAVFSNGARSYKARFVSKGKNKEIGSREELDRILDGLKDAEFTVTDVRKQEKIKTPKPPFTTSSLQQDASARLNMRPSKTMAVAQSLFEGIDLAGEGLTGMITYMRTDSLRVSDDVKILAREKIASLYGKEFVPPTPRYYKSKANAQDAHEAIRPTSVDLTPERVRASMTTEQYRLYKLIWERFIASQMASAVYDTVTVDIEANGCVFRAADSKLRQKGFTVLYNYADEEEEKSGRLPTLEKGQTLPFKEFESEQRFTQPPSRYTEGSLIKALEDNGIGRPSTYATTVSTIIERHYVERNGKVLRPTSIGEVTTDVMNDNFKDIVDMGFTAEMETKLDGIEHGQKTYLEVMKDFYGPFEKELEEAEKKLDGVHIKIPDEESDEICELCGAKMVYKVSRFGKFLACPNYPKCKNTKSIVNYADGSCPQCGGKLIIKKSAKGKTYFACENKDGCGFMTWNAPTRAACPKCGKTLFRRLGKVLECENPSCGYSERQADE